MRESDRPVSRALWIALVGNLTVSAAKIVYGAGTGTLSVIADGVHSAVDAAGSLIGLVSLRLARRPSDHDHHYGHHKFETLAALTIGGFIALTAWEVIKGAFARLIEGGSATFHPSGPVLIVLTMAFNAALSAYELRVGRRHRSTILHADAMHTRSDVLVSFVVLVSLAGIWLGIAWIDPLISLAIAGYLGTMAYRILRENVLDLSDAAFLDPGRIESIVRAVPGVIDCHKVRTRGREGAAFVDLHIQVDPAIDTTTSHDIVHAVHDRIMKREPGVRDVLVHTEPWVDPETNR
jgi:cation diffusion facilitator family transporter